MEICTTQYMGERDPFMQSSFVSHVQHECENILKQNVTHLLFLYRIAVRLSLYDTMIAGDVHIWTKPL